MSEVVSARNMSKPFTLLLVVVVVTTVGLSVFLRVPYIYSLIGFAAWAFLGHLVTADDEAPGGWSNPNGSLPFPWIELAAKALIFAALCTAAYFIPAIRIWGGRS